MPRPHLPTRLSGLPTRLKSHNGHNGHNGHSNSPSVASSRNPSPTRAMGDGKNGSLVLRTTVVKGRNLAAKDKGGTSDPYLALTLGDSREATSTVYKSLNPEWGQTFDLPVAGLSSMLLEVVCWDKDRFGKDYMGEFDIALEELFADGQTDREPTWYPLQSRKTGRKKSVVTGEVLLRFSLLDPIHTSVAPLHLIQKLMGLASASPGIDDDDEDEPLERIDTGGPDEDEETDQVDVSSEVDDPKNPEAAEKKKRRLRLARLKKKAKLRAYEFGGESQVAGVLFVEVTKITDLPPERNMTRTSFDMDPFVVTSLGKKTYRTRVVRHNLNPVYEEKLVFQVQRHETNYSLNFTVIDRDKLSGNDFIGSAVFALENVISATPEADPATGLYSLPDPPDTNALPVHESRRSRFRLPMSRSSSATSLHRLGKPSLKKENSSSSLLGEPPDLQPPPPTSVPPLTTVPQEFNGAPLINVESHLADDPDIRAFELPLVLKNKERWEDKHNPTLYIRAKYLPYRALRQQFWRAMLKQYDADDTGRINKVELTTMLDTLGSTLHESTIDGFFKRFANENDSEEPMLTFDQAVVCLEDQLQRSERKTWGATVGEQFSHHNHMSSITTPGIGDRSGTDTPVVDSGSDTPLNNQPRTAVVPALEQDHLGKEGEEGNVLDNGLDDDNREEHVIEIRECPICHQPRLNKKSDADIITHIATCASQDWRQVNNIVMAGFVTSSQAQRKWYSKVITKIGYGGYKIGANSANILVQDRVTGQINEERMSVYVRLGIRLLYKGLKSREMEKKRIRKLLRSLSIKQGKKYDDPASAKDIQGFINFHQLNMDEVLLSTDQFKNFNEFFYRRLKPDARPCSAPNDPHIIVSPADCRTVVFNQMDEAQRIWVKGREFSVERLLGKPYGREAKRYVNGALGVFRLAPQDYHRFHIPVDGIMGEPKPIEGEYYTVNPMAIRSALDVYGENVRVVVPIDSRCHGRVMVICVGAMMVGSTVITRKAGERVARAEELGYFKFGGSTLLLLFEPGVMRFDDDLVENSRGALETLVRAGMSIGHSPDHAPYAPDMRKENPSMDDRQEAKRRIEGSLAPSTGSDPVAANMQ